MGRTANFVVVTQGICFICRDKIEIEGQFSESILESIVKRNQSANQSIQYISRYLKMDMSKVFISEGAIPPHLLEKVKRSRLKVELCDDCSRLNDTFSKLFRKLEKAEIDVAACLRKIARKMGNADGVRKDGEFHKMINCEEKDGGLLEKLKIAEALRTDAVQKCNRKVRIGNERPRVKVKKLAPIDVIPKKVSERSLSGSQDSAFGGIEGGPGSPDEYVHFNTTESIEGDSIDYAQGHYSAKLAGLNTAGIRKQEK